MDHRGADLAAQARARRPGRSPLTAIPDAPVRRRRNTGRRRRRRPARCRRRSRARVLCRSTRFAGSSGLASWLGNVPSSSKYSGSHRDRRDRSQHRRCGVTGHPVARRRRRPAAAAHPSGRPASAGIRRSRRARRGRHRRRPDRRSAGTPAITSSLITDKPGVLADGLGAGAAQLDAVVGGRVVAGGEHRAGAVEQPGGEVQLIGRGQPDPDDVEALARSRRRRTRPPATASWPACRNRSRPCRRRSALVAHQPRERAARRRRRTARRFPHRPGRARHTP